MEPSGTKWNPAQNQAKSLQILWQNYSFNTLNQASRSWNQVGTKQEPNQNALNNIQLCLEKGIKTFDASVGGLGGCPYSPGAKGNVATEKVNKLLISLGYRTNLNSQKIDECSEMALKLKMGKNYDWYRKKNSNT